MKKILVTDIDTFTAVVAGLTRQGLAFTAREVTLGWEIEITGF